MEPLVVDIGSSSCKAGFAGDDAPRVIVPSVIGRFEDQYSQFNIREDNVVGNEAIQMRHDVTQCYPIEHGVVERWRDMETLLDHVISSELKADPREQPIIITEPPLNPKNNREGLAELMFESFGVPSLSVAIPGVLSLYSNGRVTGCVVDCGEGVTHTVPIYEGYAFRHAIQRTNIAGGAITNYLKELLNNDCTRMLHVPPDDDTLRSLKEIACRVSSEALLTSQLEVAEERDSEPYTLPGGDVINVGSERILAPEALFQPHLLETDSCALHDLVYETINKCDIDVRKDLYSNIILSGGTTLFPGIADRFKSELINMTHSGNIVTILAPPERLLSAWIGGSILGSLSTFGQQLVTRAEYEETGASIMHRRCH